MMLVEYDNNDSYDGPSHSPVIIHTFTWAACRIAMDSGTPVRHTSSEESIYLSTHLFIHASYHHASIHPSFHRPFIDPSILCMLTILQLILYTDSSHHHHVRLDLSRTRCQQLRAIADAVGCGPVSLQPLIGRLLRHHLDDMMMVMMTTKMMMMI